MGAWVEPIDCPVVVVRRLLLCRESETCFMIRRAQVSYVAVRDSLRNLILTPCSAKILERAVDSLTPSHSLCGETAECVSLSYW